MDQVGRPPRRSFIIKKMPSGYFSLERINALVDFNMYHLTREEVITLADELTEHGALVVWELDTLPT